MYHNIQKCIIKSTRHHVDRGQSDAHAGNSVWNSQPGPYYKNMTLRQHQRDRQLVT